MNYTALNYENLCEKLYDPKECGVVIVRSVLNPDEVSKVSTELEGNKKNYVPRPKRYGTTDQELSSWDFERAVMMNYQGLLTLHNRHMTISEGLHAVLPCSYTVDEIRTNSNFYAAGGVGIGPHRDNSFSVNLIAIYLIAGDSQFHTARNKERAGEIKFDVSPGDAVLMRGPRNCEEHSMRPVHYVNDVKTDRYIVVFREINHGLLNKVSRDSKYNA